MLVLFAGSGLWQPEADKLALLREDIDHNSHRLKAVLRRPDMRREFFKGIPDDEKKAIQAFVSQNKESALKTKPKVGTAPSRCSSHYLAYINHHCHGRKAFPSNPFEQYSTRWAN
jgi:hypothetical protein